MVTDLHCSLRQSLDRLALAVRLIFNACQRNNAPAVHQRKIIFRSMRRRGTLESQSGQFFNIPWHTHTHSAWDLPCRHFIYIKSKLLSSFSTIKFTSIGFQRPLMPQIHTQTSTHEYGQNAEFDKKRKGNRFTNAVVLKSLANYVTMVKR